MNNPVILFDGVCNLCNSSIQFIIKHDKKNIFKFASLQSKFGQKFLKERNMPAEKLHSIILYKSETAYYDKSTAVLKIAEKLEFPYNLSYIFIIIPAPIRNIIYSFVAKNRYKWFGKKDSCMIPNPELTDKFIN